MSGEKLTTDLIADWESNLFSWLEPRCGHISETRRAEFAAICAAAREGLAARKIMERHPEADFDAAVDAVLRPNGPDRPSSPSEAKRLKVEAYHYGNDHAELLGPELMATLLDEAAALLRKQADELEKCGGMETWRHHMKMLAEYEDDYQRLTKENRKQAERIRELEDAYTRLDSAFDKRGE